MTRDELILILARIAKDLQRTANYHETMGDHKEAMSVLRDAYIYSKVLDMLTDDKTAARLIEQYITNY